MTEASLISGSGPSTSPRARAHPRVPSIGVIIVAAMVIFAVGLIGIVATRQTIREIDTNSGQVREREVVFGVTWQENPIQTHFTRQFSDLIRDDKSPVWRTVSINYGSKWFRKNILSRREHYVFGDVYGKLELFALHCSNGAVGDSECETLARELLNLLSNQRAGEISARVAELEKQLSGSGDDDGKGG